MDNKTKILYVDDEETNLLLFEANFCNNYNVLIADNPVSGLETLEKYMDIEVVISDMRMPGINGIEFITKAKERFPDKYYYILTGYDITAEIQDAIEKGLIKKYFSKPFDINVIEASIGEVV